MESKTKICSMCKEEKPIENFSIRRNQLNRFGQVVYYNGCKKCRNKCRTPNNPDLVRKAVRRYYNKNRNRILEKQSIERGAGVNNLDDNYIKKTLVGKSSLSRTEIPKELIEVKRLQLTLKRELKKCKQNHLTI